MKLKSKTLVILLWLFTFTLITWCSETSNNTKDISSTDTKTITTESENVSYTDWTDETHSNSWNLDYDTVFPQDSVNRIDIVISEENWELMMDDMEWLYWEFWSKSNSKPDDVDDESSSSDKPIYVETDIYFNDTKWYNVWMKFKWHSSLKSAWSAWNLKLPFKLNFDKFEDSYEELKNQRFFWFKKLSFSSNFNDDSFIHEKLATETFQQAWIVTPNSAFYRIYVDYGNGSEYFWLYTWVEVIDDTVIDKFSDEEWNLYEAEWKWITLAEDTFDEISTHYEKKNNEDESDWSDIEKLSEVLNSDSRFTDTEEWKTNLEEVFDVDVFLNWLAVNSTIQNWDTYGVMTHNFYLYNNPENWKLTWIPWDNNESFWPWKKWIVTLTANSVSDDWPLIRYLLDNEDYREQYVEYVHVFNTNILNTNEYTNRIEELHNLVSPYVIWDEWENEGYSFLKNESSFTNSLNTILNFITWRIKAASSLSLSDDWIYSQSNNTRWGWWPWVWEWRPDNWRIRGDNSKIEWNEIENTVPVEAITACKNIEINSTCSFTMNNRNMNWICTEVEVWTIACFQENIPRR